MLDGDLLAYSSMAIYPFTGLFFGSSALPVKHIVRKLIAWIGDRAQATRWLSGIRM
jgi:hypothetical protein